MNTADSSKLLAFEMRCYRKILRVLEGQSHQQKCQIKSRKALNYNRRDKAKEVETVRTHLQNESATGEDSGVWNGGRKSVSWKTAKKLVRRHH